MKNILEKMKTTRILAIIGVIGLILGTIMPYVKYNFFGYSYSISLWGYWEGKIIMILVIATLLFVFKDFVEKYIPSLFETPIGQKIKDLDSAKYSLVPTIIVAVFAIYLTTKMGMSSFKYYNIGFYALWVGVISLVGYAILHRDNKEKEVEM